MERVPRQRHVFSVGPTRRSHRYAGRGDQLLDLAMALLGHAPARAESVGFTAWEWTCGFQGKRVECSSCGKVPSLMHVIPHGCRVI